MEQPDEPDDVRATIEAIPDEIGDPRERDPPQRAAIVSDQLAPQLRESREPISQGRQLFCEPLHARPLVAFDEKRQLSARVVAEWLRGRHRPAVAAQRVLRRVKERAGGRERCRPLGRPRADPPAGAMEGAHVGAHGAHQLLDPDLGHRREPLGVACRRRDERDTVIAVPVGRYLAAKEGRCAAERGADRAMDHGPSARLARVFDRDPHQDDTERPPAIAGRRDALAHVRHEDPIGVRVGDARPIGKRGRLRDHGRRAWRDVAEQPHDRRDHRGPALPLGHSLRRAEHGERDHAVGRRRQVPAFEKGLQRARERAGGEGQSFRRDARKQRRGPSRRRTQRVEQIETEERGRQAGARWSHHGCHLSTHGFRSDLAFCSTVPVHVVVVGAGVAGLGAALALAHRDHQVSLLERDPDGPPGDPGAAFGDWARPGVPQFRLPHLVLPLGRAVLERELPDVLAELLRVGAFDLPFRDRVPGGPTGEDADLVGVACRRPLFEWALRRGAEREARVTLRSGTRVEGLLSSGTRIIGVRTHDGAEIIADLVVDASGRGSRIGSWLKDLGLSEPTDESDPCGILYHSRYFRRDPAFEYPTRQSLFGPRGDLGYMSFATFPGEDESWCLALGVPPWDDEVRAIRRTPAFMAAARAIPAIVPLLDASEPLTDVLLMGELRNRTRRLTADGEPIVTGIVLLGDALMQTDPSWGWGMSIGLEQAIRLAELVDAHGNDAHALALAFDGAVADWSAGYYRASRDLDRGRTGLWRGELSREAAFGLDGPLFLISAFPAAGRVDPEIFRAASRRSFLLDPIDPPPDRSLLERAAAIFTQQQRSGPAVAPLGPDRDTMLGLVRGASPA